MTDTADVVVIGGGVQGASLAFHLASRGARVTVVERSTIGAGATGRSSGPRPRLLRPARRGAGRRGGDRVVPRLGGSGRRRLRLHPGRVPVDRARRRDRSRARQRREPPRARRRQPRVDAAAIRELAPGLAIADDEVAAWEPESGYADPSMTAGSFMRAARDRGARLVQGAAVTAIPVEGGRVRGVVTSRRGDRRARRRQRGGRLGGDASPALAGLDLPLTVWRHDTGYLGVPASVPRPIPVVIDIPNEMYFRPEGGELVLIGLEDDNQMGGDPDRETATAAAAFHDRAAERIVRRVPGLIDGDVPDVALGPGRPDDADQRPLLGPAGPDGFFLDCGHSGTGFKTSPAVGLGMAELDPRRRAAIRGPGAVRVHARSPRAASSRASTAAHPSGADQPPSTPSTNSSRRTPAAASRAPSSRVEPLAAARPSRGRRSTGTAPPVALVDISGLTVCCVSIKRQLRNGVQPVARPAGSRIAATARPTKPHPRHGVERLRPAQPLLDAPSWMPSARRSHGRMHTPLVRDVVGIARRPHVDPATDELLGLPLRVLGPAGTAWPSTASRSRRRVRRRRRSTRRSSTVADAGHDRALDRRRAARWPCASATSGIGEPHEEERELVAHQAAADVLRAGEHLPSRSATTLITSSPTAHEYVVVDPVEPVEVDHDAASRRAGMPQPHPADLAIDLLEERRLLVQAGERVDALVLSRAPGRRRRRARSTSGAHQPTVANAMTSIQISATSSSVSRRKSSTTIPKTPRPASSSSRILIVTIARPFATPSRTTPAMSTATNVARPRVAGRRERGSARTIA